MYLKQLLGPGYILDAFLPIPLTVQRLLLGKLQITNQSPKVQINSLLYHKEEWLQIACTISCFYAYFVYVCAAKDMSFKPKCNLKSSQN